MVWGVYRWLGNMATRGSGALQGFGIRVSVTAQILYMVETTMDVDADVIVYPILFP